MIETPECYQPVELAAQPALDETVLGDNLHWMDNFDPTLCPICQSPNACAMEKARTTGTAPVRCWCVDAVFTPEVLALLPEQAQGRSCICTHCANSVG